MALQVVHRRPLSTSPTAVAAEEVQECRGALQSKKRHVQHTPRMRCGMNSNTSQTFHSTLWQAPTSTDRLSVLVQKLSRGSMHALAEVSACLALLQQFR